MKLVTLAELVERAKDPVTPRQLLRMLQALERDPALHGMSVLVPPCGRGGRWLVKEHVLDLLRTRETSALSGRLDAVEARTTSLEFRVDTLEANQSMP